MPCESGEGPAPRGGGDNHKKLLRVPYKAGGMRGASRMHACFSLSLVWFADVLCFFLTDVVPGPLPNTPFVRLWDAPAP